MNQQNHHARRLSWLAIAFVLVLTGCGGDTDSSADTQASESEPTTATTTPDSVQGERLNLNSATPDQFRTIPNVGDRMVREFVEYRPYVSVRQFRQEIGKYVDEEQVAAYEQYVYVPVDANESDAETLRQLPGVDAAEADSLIAGRPYASNEAFLDRLSEYVTDEELTIAESYLVTQ